MRVQDSWERWREEERGRWFPNPPHISVKASEELGFVSFLVCRECAATVMAAEADRTPLDEHIAWHRKVQSATDPRRFG